MRVKGAEAYWFEGFESVVMAESRVGNWNLASEDEFDGLCRNCWGKGVGVRLCGHLPSRIRIGESSHIFTHVQFDVLYNGNQVILCDVLYNGNQVLIELGHG
ncbi:hypothetical protein LR48_Vigan304s004200 [Vigna angularis]|uniref:Uncharacterized protein n=1 Tax=Phaseolus angularis TaxID=3914 RepID=A0A0L9T7W7_PHAAN|nr:hypothetical protein LR48_Vigan304s004200 [Vigna angularis]